MTRPPPAVHGLAVVDKPAGWTSHDVVARCRRLLGTRKVGHSGTLDPGATGVLLVGAGHATRLLRFLGDLPKAYVGEVVLGATTTTLDDEGDVVATFAMDGVTLEAARAASAALVGPIMQVPPMVSAVQVGGQRLHDLARQGIEVHRDARPVTVHSLRLDGTDDPLVLRLAVTCSTGTYVRVLAADLGALLGGGAHLRRLRRTAIGPFDEASATPLDHVDPGCLAPPLAAVAHLHRVEVDESGAVDVAHGKVLPAWEGDGPWAVTGPAGDLLAVYEHYRPGLAKPAVVLPADS
ncbi:MAG: tRNA pseudouridine(55) synthase TruB [Acidimicrobiales bacterium]